MGFFSGKEVFFSAFVRRFYRRYKSDVRVPFVYRRLFCFFIPLFLGVVYVGNDVRLEIFGAVRQESYFSHVEILY